VRELLNFTVFQGEVPADNRVDDIEPCYLVCRAPQGVTREDHNIAQETWSKLSFTVGHPCCLS
jgi:hypothetical protein